MLMLHLKLKVVPEDFTVLYVVIWCNAYHLEYGVIIVAKYPQSIITLYIS